MHVIVWIYQHSNTLLCHSSTCERHARLVLAFGGFPIYKHFVSAPCYDQVIIAAIFRRMKQRFLNFNGVTTFRRMSKTIS